MGNSTIALNTATSKLRAHRISLSEVYISMTLIRLLVVSLDFHQPSKPIAKYTIASNDFFGTDKELKGPKLKGICKAILRTVSAAFLATRPSILIREWAFHL